MVKGAGMIRPNLATMLSFLVTDANIKAPLLQQILDEVAEFSYNRITIDGETSTNDTVLLLANGKSGHPPINRMDRDGALFQLRLLEVCQNLAKSVVKDGEGATKFVEIRVKGARKREDAKRAAYALPILRLSRLLFLEWMRIGEGSCAPSAIQEFGWTRIESTFFLTGCPS
jgi:glutamate N-acetyltransferase/amino-acid N-acetyltransferase